MKQVTTLPELPPVDTRSLAMSGRDIEYINGYEAGYERAADQMREYATSAVLAEREACWEEINKHIKDGPLPGNGWDKCAERNGLVLACNILAQRGKQ